MRIVGFEAGPLKANCYVVTGSLPGSCVVVDPGQQALQPLARALDAARVRPAAVLVTHGHFDHVACAGRAGRVYGVEVYLGGGDVPMLTDQLAALSPELRAAIAGLLGPGESMADLADMRPDRLTPLAGGEHLSLAGLEIDVIAVPGHTPGSLAYRLRDAGSAAGGVDRPGGEAANATAGDAHGATGVASARGAHAADPAEVVLTGDTLFAGTIGRTDLPGGSTERILASIRAGLLTLPDAMVVLPGHGPATTIGAERTDNPFLAVLG